MKKIFYKGLLGISLALSLVFLMSGQIFAETADEFVEQGKEELFDNADPWAALAKFDAALGLDPEHQKANFWRAATVGCSNSGFVNTLQDLNIIDVNNDWLIFDAEYEENYPPETSVANIIMDDNNATYTGTWGILTSPDPNNPYGDQCRSHDAGTGTNKATWRPNIITLGYYDVYVWVPTAPTNAIDAKFTINHADGSTVITRNQNGSGAAHWFHLGQYRFSAGTSGSIVLSDLATGRVIADAIKLEYIGIIKDNSDASGFTTSGGGWNNETGGFKNNHIWHAAGTGATATWAPFVPQTGEYIVLAYWQRYNDSAISAQYTITPNGGAPRIVTLSQKDYNEEWISLGVYEFTAGTGNTIQLASNADGRVVADAIRIVPLRQYPDLSEGQTLSIGMEGEGTEALGNIGDVTNPFQDMINPTGEETFDLDYGEVKALETSLYLGQAMSNMAAAYDMDTVDVAKVVCDPDPLSFLDVYTNFGSLMPDAGTRLSNAKTALENSIASYLVCSDYIRNTRTDDDGLNHLVMFYLPYDPAMYDSYEEWEEEKALALAVEENIRNILTAIYNNLTNHEANPYVEILFPLDPDDMEEITGGGGPGINIAIDFYEFFTNPKDIRSFADQILASNIILDGFDATFGGVFPLMNEEDLNFILGVGPNLKDEPLVLWGSDTPSIKLEWGSVSDEFISNFVKYEIRRSTTPDVDITSELVATITDIGTTTFTDDTIDGLSNEYYYRVFTYYDFGGGNTAKTYSELGKAILRLYADAGYAGGDEDGSQSAPYSDLGDAIEEVGNGTKVCVAEGTYYESAMTLRLWNTSGVVLEGGYESSGWTRDIEAHETIIDATGSSDWACVGISNIDGFTIDGFTIANVVGQQYASGIDAWRSNDVVIRNCTIINSNRGISINESSSCLIENCNIQGRKAQSTGIECISVWRSESVNIGDCTIMNSNNVGIGIWENSQVSVSDSIIADNNQYGIQLSNSSDVSIFNNIIKTNNVGGIGCWNTNSVNISIMNNTIVGNGNAGGINYSNGPYSLEIKNNIITNSFWGISGNLGVAADITHNNAYGNTNGNYFNCGTGAGQDNNISADPLFVTGSDGNYYLSQTSSGQGSTSPCVDSGSDTASNLNLSDGYTTRTNLKPDVGTVDMGYHYLTTLPLELPYSPIVTADLDGNGQHEVVVDFGDPYGIWIYYNNSTWTQLHTISPEFIAEGKGMNIDGDAEDKEDLIIDFGDPYGIWIYYNNSTWTQLHTISPELITFDNIDQDPQGRDDIIIDFGDPYGIWVYYNNSTWSQLHSISPEQIITENIDNDPDNKFDVIVDFGDPYGIWIYYNNSTWTQLHAVNPEDMVVDNIDNDAEGKDDIIIDFGDPYGIWIYYNNSTWSQLHTMSPESMITGPDPDGDDSNDVVIIDFGSPYGIWIYYNNSTWSQLHTVSPEWMAIGALDNNELADIIIDFGDPYGIWVYYNNSTWVQLHTVSP